MTGNEHWLPSEQLLKLSNLTTVEGVRLSQYCQDCSLRRITSDDVNSSCLTDRRLSSTSDWLWHDEIQYDRALDFVKLGFWPTCLTDGACRIDQFDFPSFTSLYDVNIKASYVLYATGSVALLVNIAVVVFIVFHKSLRNDLAVRLLLNIAWCDVLVSFSAVLYTKYNPEQTYRKYVFDQLQGNHYEYDIFLNMLEKQANIVGPILTCAVTAQVFGSVLGMTDKFFKIVFAMNPGIRLGRKTAVLCLSLSWLLSASFAVLPIYGIGRMRYADSSGSSPLPTDEMTKINGKWKYEIGFAASLQFTLIILLLASFVLYVPIFIVAKTSGANVGVKREAEIARKIALLLCINLILFVVPVVVGVFQPTLWLDLVEDWRSHTLIGAQWFKFLQGSFPILCLSINSCLNPFLYALRHPQIKQKLTPLLSRCGATTRECFRTLRQNLRCHTGNEESINNDVEMREGRIAQHASLPKESNYNEEQVRAKEA